MPKPILSDSLFNADDVATAVLAEANLQVANSSLGVTDIESSLSLGTNVEDQYTPGSSIMFYHFNGFVFLTGTFKHNGSPSNNQVVLQITDSQYRPKKEFYTNSIHYQGDQAERIFFETGGDIKLINPSNTGASTFYFLLNTHWRVA